MMILPDGAVDDCLEDASLHWRHAAWTVLGMEVQARVKDVLNHVYLRSEEGEQEVEEVPLEKGSHTIGEHSLVAGEPSKVNG